jgi:ABC-type polysaccharide/polyol phosphate export permease
MSQLPATADAPRRTASELRGFRELLVNLTLREVRGKYKRTVLGQGWSLLNPVAAMLIFTAVFGLLLRIKVPAGSPSGVDIFALWLVCGLLPWNFLTSAMTGGMGALVGNANLIKKVYFPREVLVAATVLSWDVSFLFELGVLAAALMIFGAFVLPWLPVAAVFVVLLTAFALGLGLALSVANVYFRDTTHFMNILLQIWFYATPVVYPMSYVTEAARKLDQKGFRPFGHHFPLEFIYRLNPMERFVNCFRATLYDNRWPALADSLYAATAAAASLLIGYAVFRRYEGRLAEEL